MRSLWSGVSGLQAHQTAMDVEGNNIANVNTTGFKYSRANFADMLSQTSKIATAPQNDLGGKNSLQIGLGTSVSSVTKIFSQGSIQSTDKNTDLAIQGDGFFVVSADAGKSYKYTRSGDFKFDASGNFVDTNGLIVQGWTRDETTGDIDTSAPISSIVIPPGLTTPANSSTQIVLKANLNSGGTNTVTKPTYSSAQLNAASTSYVPGATPDDMGILFNGSGSAYNLASAATGPGVGGQGVFISTDGGATYAEFRYTNNPANIDLNGTGAAGVATPPTQSTGAASTNADVYYFRTTEDFRSALQNWVTTNVRNPTRSAGAAATINSEGKIEISNAAGGALSLATGGIVDGNTINNTVFTQAISSINGALPVGSGVKTTQAFNAATHSASIDIYDSLGSKHTATIDFRKVSQSTSSGATWSFNVTVPLPGSLTGATAPYTNTLTGGFINFNNDGSLSSYSPPSISYTANNGSSPNQNVNLLFGSVNGFDGITSYDSTTTTGGISQDGYAGGDLTGIRIDQSGTLIGSFSNGRSFGLAQVSMAKFANNEGLMSEGNNVYTQSANSGDPIIGTASTAGRGYIQSSSLEMSNVDLSRSLTELIIIQRGYQANSKTITTADQLLNTLLQLKQ